MARAYADGYNKEYQQIAYDAFLCGYGAKCESFVSEGLEEAAREYAKEYTKNEGNGGDDWEDDIQITFKAGAEWQKEKTAWVYLKEAKDAVIALEKEKGEPLNPRVAFVNGARWQKQQMLEKAVEGTVCKDESDVWIELRPDALPNFKDMQPVKLIVKEDVE